MASKRSTRSLAPLARILSILAVAALFLACGGGGSGSGSQTDGGSGSGAAGSGGGQATEPAGSATVSGTVHFEGEAPERTPLDVNRECMKLRQEAPLSENVVVNDNGTLRWVFLQVTEGLGDREFPAPEEPVVLDQNACMYTPHVFGVQAGQPIEIRNSDPFQHNIHALPEVNRGFNFSQPVQGMSQERTFMQPETMVRIKCDVHAWMEAYAGVTSHPFYATSDSTGGYTIENLPAGEYTIEAWHETYGTQSQTVKVEDGGSATLDFTFTADAAS